MKLDAIFFAAHPDDIEISCGGTAILLAEIGKKTGIVDLTKGELSTRGNLALRKKETEKANKILGISKRINLSIPDGNIQNTPSNRLKIIRILREYRPKIIFIPFSNDRHPDHYHTNILVKEAAFYSGLVKIRTHVKGKLQKAYRPGKNYYYMQTYSFEPGFIINITNVFKTKMDAIKCYASQFSESGSKGKRTFISDPKFIMFLEARARYFGFRIGTEYGEPFFIDEKINLNPEELFRI